MAATPRTVALPLLPVLLLAPPPVLGVQITPITNLEAHGAVPQYVSDELALTGPTPGGFFLWKDAAFTPILEPEATAMDVASGDVVVGHHRSGTTTQPFRWQSSVLETLPHPGLVAAAFGANANGDAVGQVQLLSQDDRAAHWTGSEPPILLATLGGPFAMDAAIAVNGSAQIVGYAYPPSEFDHATLWEGASVTDLGALLPSEGWSYAVDINDSGVAVGRFEPATGGTLAVHWQNTTATLLPGFGYDSEALAISDTGVVIGWAETATGWAPVRWTRTTSDWQIEDLSHVYEAETGWVIDEVLDITACGTILAEAHHPSIPEHFVFIDEDSLRSSPQACGCSTLTCETLEAPCPTMVPQIVLRPLKADGACGKLPEAVYIEPENNYSENLRIRIEAIVPTGECAGKLATCFQGTVYLFEPDDLRWICEDRSLESECPDPLLRQPQMKVRDATLGFFRADTGAMLEREGAGPYTWRYRIELVNGVAEVVAKSLAWLDGGLGLAPPAAEVAGWAQGSPMPTTGTFIIPMWVDVTNDGPTGPKPGTNNVLDWVERHHWDIWRELNVPSAPGEPGEMVDRVQGVYTDWRSGTERGKSEGQAIWYNPALAEMRAPKQRVLQYQVNPPCVYDDPLGGQSASFETCKVFTHIGLHESRHAWTHFIRNFAVGSCLSDDTAGTPEDNDDDPGGPDTLPEEALIGGDCALGEYSSATGDASPVKDPDAVGSSGGETTFQAPPVAARLNECDASDSGHDWMYVTH